MRVQQYRFKLKNDAAVHLQVNGVCTTDPCFCSQCKLKIALFKDRTKKRELRADIKAAMEKDVLERGNCPVLDGAKCPCAQHAYLNMLKNEAG